MKNNIQIPNPKPQITSNNQIPKLWILLIVIWALNEIGTLNFEIQQYENKVY